MIAYAHSGINKKIDLLPRESYIKVENFVEQLIASDQHSDKERAFRTFNG